MSESEYRQEHADGAVHKTGTGSASQASVNASTATGGGGAPAHHHGHALASILGPAFVAAVAYVDPGNVAANITSGARYGYLLVWVLIVANLMSVLI